MPADPENVTRVRPEGLPLTDPEDSEIRLTSEPDGRSTRVELIVQGRSVSRCWIVSQRIRLGAAIVRMDGIGGVGTDETERRKGYAARVLWAALRRMQAGDAALTMLYGIPDFYTRFGYAPAGPEHLIRLPATKVRPPEGWTYRPLRPDDLPRLHELYDQQTAGAIGAAVRTPTCYANRQLRAAAEATRSVCHHDDLCRVVAGPDGTVCGYAWRGNGFWATEELERAASDSLVISEAVAASPEAADCLIAVCRLWAWETAQATGRAVENALISGPHDGPVAAAAMRTDATLVRRFTRCGGSMVRVLSLVRLMQSLVPEIECRLRTAGIRLVRPFTIALQSGEAVTIHGAIHRARLESERRDDDDPGHAIILPDSELARAVLGAVKPDDTLDRAAPRATPRVRRLFSALFPERCPHMYLPDRY